MRHYAIGDIHGQLALLKAAHDAIERDAAAHGGPFRVVHVGDYVDRGPQSNETIEYLIKGREHGAPWVFLRGNHDRMMRNALRTPPERDPRLRREMYWLHARLGGLSTLASYGVKVPRVAKEKEAGLLLAAFGPRVPAQHIEFLDELINSAELSSK